MNAALAITTALLDSSAEEFMKSYKQAGAARWEFEPTSVIDIYSVNRWNYDGTYNHIGSVRQVGSGDWWTHAVGGWTVTKRYRYVSHEGPFKTKEEAAEKLWELHEAPR